MSSRDHPDPDLSEMAPPDGGEPQGAYDGDRPAMLGRRFRRTLATGMLTGLVLALCAHALLVYFWYSASAWSWLIVGLGGLAVGGALTLSLFGVATDRTDTGPKEHGRADIQERGEWRRTLDRRRARRGAPGPR
jgi:hypothetical protein